MIKKETAIIGLIFLFMIFVSVPEVNSYPKFFDRFTNKENLITGEAPSQTATVSITVGNNAPIIGNVTLDMADSIAITENGNKSFLFSFVAVDQEGVGN